MTFQLFWKEKIFMKHEKLQFGNIDLRSQFQHKFNSLWL